MVQKIKKIRTDKNKLEKQALQQRLEIKEEYSGLIPHPKMMAQYEQICPGAADRILKMTENQLSHTQQLECKEHDSIVKCRDKALQSEIRLNNLGQFYGFIIILCCIIGGFILILNNKPVGGYGTIITSILTFAGSVFYKNKKSTKNK